MNADGRRLLNLNSARWIADWLSRSRVVRFVLTGSVAIAPRKGHLIYWAVAATIILVGYFTSHRLAQPLAPLRYRIDRAVRAASPFPTDPAFTVLVLIDDDAYWGPELAHSNPLKREYLATLIGNVASFNPAVIALDVRLHSPDPAGNTRTIYESQTSLPVDQAYVEQTVMLCESIMKAAQSPHGPTLVLAESMHVDEKGNCTRMSDAYDGFDFRGAKIRSGFLNLDEEDYRCVTPVQVCDRDKTIDSFSQAVVRAIAPRRASRLEPNTDYFTELIESYEFERISAERLNRAIRDNDAEAKARLSHTCAHKAVIIGGDYHKEARGYGEFDDNHYTPLGDFRGVYLHASYVEGLLSGRAVPISMALVSFVEVALSLVLAWVLITGLLSTSWKIFLILFILVAPFFLSYLALFNFGLYLDLSTVLMLLLVHLWLHKKDLVEGVKPLLVSIRDKLVRGVRQ